MLFKSRKGYIIYEESTLQFFLFNQFILQSRLQCENSHHYQSKCNDLQ